MEEHNTFSKYEDVGSMVPCSSQHEHIRNSKDIQELVDAISGATWETRNQIMQDRFQQNLHVEKDALPAFKPPGE